MKKYSTENLRNVALISHGGAGKTSLAEAMLFAAGVIDRLGKVEAGTTVSDSDPDEISRQVSISASLLPLEWKEHKVNLLDTPGYADFIGEVASSLRVADAVALLVDATSGVEVGTERYLEMSQQRNLPCLVVINKLDKENTDFERTLGELKGLSFHPVALYLPLVEGGQLRGLVDLINQQALAQAPGAQVAASPVPAELTERVSAFRERLVEAAAESTDELTEKYLEEGDLSPEELHRGLRQAVLSGKAAPAIPAAAASMIGVAALLDTIVDLLPSPAERPPAKGINPNTQAAEERKPSAQEPMSALVFKTTADPYAGRMNFFRTYSGTLHSDAAVLNASRESKERIGQAFVPRGKQQDGMPAVAAGDMAVVAKLHQTVTGDTLCEEAHPIRLEGIEFPEPVISVAISPKTKGEEDKVGQALSRMVEEDPTIRVNIDSRTKQTLLSGMGDVHLEIVVERMKRKFGVEVVTEIPRVAYLETIAGAAQVQGKYKKQTGGRGQYGDVWLELQPLERGQGFEFVDRVVGGVVPRNFIPAVEKGIREAMERGILAGCTVTDLRAILYDGSYHSVDSSDMAFKIAGSMALQKGVLEAGPVLLEPVMEVEVMVPEAYMGDVIGALNSKRGRILGTEPRGGFQVVQAQVPQAEMFRYATELRSMTQGRGSHSMKFSHYEQVPAHLAQQIIEEHKQEREKER